MEDVLGSELRRLTDDRSFRWIVPPNYNSVFATGEQLTDTYNNFPPGK